MSFLCLTFWVWVLPSGITASKCLLLGANWSVSTWVLHYPWHRIQLVRWERETLQLLHIWSCICRGWDWQFVRRLSSTTGWHCDGSWKLYKSSNWYWPGACLIGNSKSRMQMYFPSARMFLETLFTEKNLYFSVSRLKVALCKVLVGQCWRNWSGVILHILG